MDNATPALMEIPGSDSEDENGPIRRIAVLINRVALHVSTPLLVVGSHTLKIQAVDPGVVIDEISFP